jgi:hypothetical protein
MNNLQRFIELLIKETPVETRRRVGLLSANAYTA